MRRGTLQQRLRELPRLVHLGDDVAAADQLAVDEQLRDRRPVARSPRAPGGCAGRAGRRPPRTGASSACRTATVRAEKPHAGASGVPFMNRITLCSAIASAIASRIGLDSLAGAGVGGLAGAALRRASARHRNGVWLAGHGSAPGCQLVGICRRGCWVFSASAWIGAADLRAEDLVDETVLLDAAEARRTPRP